MRASPAYQFKLLALRNNNQTKLNTAPIRNINVLVEYLKKHNMRYKSYYVFTRRRRKKIDSESNEKFSAKVKVESEKLRRTLFSLNFESNSRGGTTLCPPTEQ